VAEHVLPEPATGENGTDDEDRADHGRGTGGVDRADGGTRGGGGGP
jgi:hypothetical protein